MPFIKHVSLFIKNIFKQLRRKWLSLPLLLLFPVLIISLIFIILITFVTPNEQEPIKIGLIDLDESQETSLIVELISESTELGSFIEIEQMTDTDANRKLDNDELHVSITFPENFTTHLYEGQSINLAVIGNQKHPTESYLVNEIITSVTRLISSAQANILTINHYAKELSLDYETRIDMLFEQFKDFLFFTLGKDQIIDREDLVNYAASSPLYYYGLAAWFIMIIIWLLVFYNFLFTEDTVRIKQRIKLYGVTELQEKLARIFVTLFTVSIVTLSTFIGLKYILDLQLIQEDYLRIAAIIILHSIIFISLLAISEILIKSHKIRLLIQSIFTILLIILSGAIVPSIYFPIKIQHITSYLFSHDAFFWLQEVLLQDRYYTNFTTLLLTSLATICILIGLSVWKERLNQ